MATRIVVEWTRASLRVALAEGGSRRYRLLALHVLPITTGAAAIPEPLRERLGKIASGSARVIGVVPREQVITRVVAFPSTQVAELAQMVALYAKGQLPYPPEQTVADFHVVSRQGGFSTVAIVICQREVVEQHLAILREAGLSPSLFTVSSWGVLGWYQRLRGGAETEKGKKLPEEPSLVLNIDETRTDLVFVADNRVLSSRSIGQGALDWERVGDPTELLALEIDRSRASLRKELPGREMRSFIVTGTGALAHWAPELSRRLGVPAVVIEADQPWRGSVPDHPEMISPVVAGGLACSDSAQWLNLTPPELRVQLGHRRQVRELVTVSAFLIGALALGAGVLGMQMIREQRSNRQLDRALASLEPTAQQLQAKGRTTHAIVTILEERRRLAADLSEVFRTSAERVALEGLTFERARREIVLRGSAPSTQAVLDYMTQLNRLEGISGVELKYSTRRASSAGERTEFEIVLHQRLGAAVPAGAPPTDPS
ncbi:MAG: pilus assembly protein PilM [Candidatus Omnitrophica bacterium]|nr:pilus assembly protein PilM [Candidatus Omnitrophota bacterium]